MAGYRRTVVPSAQSQTQTQTPCATGVPGRAECSGSRTLHRRLPTADQRAGLAPYEPGPNVVALPPADPAPAQQPAAPAASEHQPAAPAVQCDSPQHLSTSATTCSTCSNRNIKQSATQPPAANPPGSQSNNTGYVRRRMIEINATTSNSIHNQVSMDQRSFVASRLQHQPDPQPILVARSSRR